MDDSDDAPILPRPGRRQMPTRRTRAATRTADLSDDEEIPVPTKSRPKRKAVEKKPAPKKRARVGNNEEEDDEDSDVEEETNRGVFKEGQRTVCPPMGDPARAFYESLIQEKPKSIIAIKWCIEHGVLMGSQLKQSLQYYKSLKSSGAFKPGFMGGLKPEFEYLFK
eukprot:Protomagalhaensia_wolfi_Nauph_80__5466@NODE_598_length_2230_cov_187_559562_g448_i0_p2_GENE_NODE_598_length_2230_cov_187_559562_g448_i0NODE_598_length_2230_cov_187_559562_g448_i0_p2_ORF_typecomplete_len166_score29_79_NODE_598_length_2230_cov_187_559562_g448_i014761973